MVLLSSVEAYQQDRLGLLKRSEPLREPTGLRSWIDIPLGLEDYRHCASTFACNKDDQNFDMRGLSRIGFPNPTINLEIQGIGDFYSQARSPVASYSSGTSNDCNSAGTSTVDSTEDASLSSYLMDGNVRAMLKKVTVNEGVLNQTIQSLGGGEKGLKELMAYIMAWVKEQNGENCDKLFLSQNLEKLNPPQMNPTFGFAPSLANNIPTCNLTLGTAACDQRSDNLRRTFDTVQSSDDTQDLNQVIQCSKSRRLMVEGEVDSSYRADAYPRQGTFLNARGSVSEDFHSTKLESNMTNPSPIDAVVLQGMSSELGTLTQQAPCSQFGLSFNPGQNELNRTLAASTRAARRNRLSRQRQSVQQSHRRSPTSGTTVTSGGCGLWSASPPALDFMNTRWNHPGTQMPLGASVKSEKKGNTTDMLTFLLQKELRPSDVGNLGRIILPKKEAEVHLPILALREGVSLLMEDFDSGYCWNIRYRFWPNNKSRMYLLENTGEFVKSHHLKEGDLLILYRNEQGNYVLRGKKKVPSETRVAYGSQHRTAHSLACRFSEGIPNKIEESFKDRDFGGGLTETASGKLKIEVKAEPLVVQPSTDGDKFEDVMSNIGSSFATEGPLQPLERFPSLNLDFPLDEIMAGIPKEEDNDLTIEPHMDSKVKTEPAG
ncbi:uncharacterized protein [Physcomitrium patens]|uniref:Transcription factor ABI3-like n=2 Tax=Physcomitrium patens TaxID=3218 RepID=Q2ABS0_PHYPA|nr:B3 domain-containing transcription factor ABI3-like isoform X1 [Physcomitrium patens]PNR59356.1 hypothetical protein PHYPA_002147 [Physcomitrium patens]BAE80314.1 transcription factor ABI3-like [Physcomitrium patens]|eukprot:XP_024360671.1 B3 domain-containing transcription factor ABI3-like isoform X1 [Physcomitrella patens]